jgi:hypothetical protein
MPHPHVGFLVAPDISPDADLHRLERARDDLRPALGEALPEPRLLAEGADREFHVRMISE